MSTIKVRVAEITELSPDVRAFDLVPLNGTPLPAFSPGSHIVVHVPGEDRVRRNPYSLASSPWDPARYRIAVRRIEEGRGGSLGMHERVRWGDVLEIEAPHNLFAPDRAATRHVLVAGGIGITPFVSYAHALLREDVPFELHYAFRAPEHAALLDDLTEVCPEALRTYVDEDGTALLAGLHERLTDQPLGTHLSVCGPAPLMDAVLGLARELGWPESRLHLERFALDEGPRRPFSVRLRSTDEVIDVPEELTLLEALEERGIEIPYLCRQGVCGECRTPVVSGTPDHRDDYLTADERAAGDALMPCVSRCARGPLVLDL